ncbi:hypothetical protein BDP81DRAFT_428595 [Colletotrichum phormii]|uniref:Uncharacterized protein n=1 Tax=Colletotrichum phormii TaxID=359342 RepID=A0AAI9ZS75_9PEZI|nr:uncharacterized protein BDP81DRAFT_428595 [Colletotrichum phormii]KAK1636906.1 hypothetical protein BDP81DRAFT_428595 [Colletotrichum phormii]
MRMERKRFRASRFLALPAPFLHLGRDCACAVGEETVWWRWGIIPMLAGPFGFLHTNIVGQAGEQTGKKIKEKII